MEVFFSFNWDHFLITIIITIILIIIILIIIVHIFIILLSILLSLSESLFLFLINDFFFISTAELIVVEFLHYISVDIGISFLILKSIFFDLFFVF